ncbi:MAG: hypothetical protein Q8O46_00360 [bacterium]|nr:hypothetical protein [bacterium]
MKMEGMKGFEFVNYFDKVPHVKSMFINVFSIDQIPTIIPLRKFLVCNLSESKLPGSHWVVLVRSEKETLEIFNSLGFINLDLIAPYLKFRNKIKVHFNEDQFQSDNSTSCGKFCIYFAVQRILNLDMSFEHILELIFNLNKEINELTVTKFCENILSNHDTNCF